jgi:putative transposase
MNRGNNRAVVFHSDAEYWQFIGLLAEAQCRIPLDILAACLMPNHFHVVCRPHEGGDMGRWVHWLLTTHVRRARLGREGVGHLWQGRYKAFPIQNDDHLLTVLRYVERNAVRSGLVARAEQWPWGSLSWRAIPAFPVGLAPSPVPMPSNWVEFVNAPLTATELEAVRQCSNRQRPYGSASWVEITSNQLGLQDTLRRVGRPGSK